MLLHGLTIEGTSNSLRNMGGGGKSFAPPNLASLRVVHGVSFRACSARGETHMRLLLCESVDRMRGRCGMQAVDETQERLEMVGVELDDICRRLGMGDSFQVQKESRSGGHSCATEWPRPQFKPKNIPPVITSIRLKLVCDVGTAVTEQYCQTEQRCRHRGSPTPH